MIGRLRGEILDKSSGTALIDVNGVGYEVSVPDSVLVQLPSIGECAELVIRQVFREDGVTLYGFLSLNQRQLFDLLTDVKGCGPKIGLSLLGQVGEESVLSAILNQESKTLTRASGVGVRLAERILLELKDKVQEELLLRKISTSQSKIAPSKSSTEDEEVIDALISLGYRRNEAEASLSNLESGLTVQERIRMALRALKK